MLSSQSPRQGSLEGSWCYNMLHGEQIEITMQNWFHYIQGEEFVLKKIITTFIIINLSSSSSSLSLSRRGSNLCLNHHPARKSIRLLVQTDHLSMFQLPLEYRNWLSTLGPCSFKMLQDTHAKHILIIGNVYIYQWSDVIRLYIYISVCLKIGHLHTVLSSLSQIQLL